MKVLFLDEIGLTPVPLTSLPIKVGGHYVLMCKISAPYVLVSFYSLNDS